MTQPQTSTTADSATTDAPPAVHTAWAAVMADVRAVGKTDEVKTGPARFNFRGIDGVLNAVGPIFRKHGVYVAPTSVDILSTEHNPTRSGGMMKNVTICVTWRVTGPAGDGFTGVSLGEGSDAGDKAVSKAHSVAYRTFLIQALALPTDEPDPDHTIYERAAEPEWGSILQNVESKRTEEELRKIWDDQNIGTAPQWVNERFTRHLNTIRDAASTLDTNTPDPVTDPTRRRMFFLFTKKGIPEEQQLAGINHITSGSYESRGDITESDAKRVIEQLETRPDAAADAGDESGADSES